MKYSSDTPKIGALLLSFESAEQTAINEEMKSEIRKAFQGTMKMLIPFKLTGVIHQNDGNIKLGIFQDSDTRDKWIKRARRKKLETLKGNGYNLEPDYIKSFHLDYSKIIDREISDDLSQVIYTISN